MLSLLALLQHLIATFRRYCLHCTVLDQVFISLGNFFFVWNSSRFYSIQDSALTISFYTIAISFYPFYYSLILQPLYTIYNAGRSSRTYLVVLALLSFALSGLSAFLFSLVIWRSSLNAVHLLASFTFTSSFFFADYSRRLVLISQIPASNLATTSCLLFLTRSSSLIIVQPSIFISVNVISNIYAGIFLLRYALSSTQFDLVSNQKTGFILRHDHLPLLSSLAPLGLVSFAVGILPSLYSINLPSLQFVFVSRIRSLFSLFNPFFEFLDGAYFLRSPLSTDREHVVLGRLASFIALLGMLTSYLVASLLTHYKHSSSFVLSPLFSTNVTPNAALFIFLLVSSIFFAYSVRVILVLYRRFSFHGSELLVASCSLPCLFILLKPPTLASVSFLYFLIALSQLIASLLIYYRRFFSTVNRQ